MVKIPPLILNRVPCHKAHHFELASVVTAPVKERRLLGSATHLTVSLPSRAHVIGAASRSIGKPSSSFLDHLNYCR